MIVRILTTSTLLGARLYAEIKQINDHILKKQKETLKLHRRIKRNKALIRQKIAREEHFIMNF